MHGRTDRSKGAGEGRFRTLRRIGAGGMGVVFSATDSWVRKPVALKMAYARRGQRRQANAQLRREALALALVDDPHVCGIYDLASHGGQVCLVLERLIGESLQARLVRGRPDNRELLDTAVQVAQALDAIHAAGLVHQDIKPANIFLTRAGVVKVLDFGIAVPAGAPSGGTTALNARGRQAVLGSPHYVSPERLLRRPADPRSDLFSLGAVLYEMATGVAPFAADTPGEMLMNVLDARPVPVTDLAPDRPAALAALVHGLLAQRAKDRCQTAREVVLRLQTIQQAIALAAAMQPARLAAA